MLPDNFNAGLLGQPGIPQQMGGVPRRTVSMRQAQQQQIPQLLQSTQILPPRFLPLSPDAFASAYANFCAKANVHPDPSELNRDGRQINLYQLHIEVMNMGTNLRMENDDDAWATIGGKLGFVQIPASDTEPAKCGSGMAAHLHHVYKQYLATFDTMYINSIVRRKNEMRNQTLRVFGRNMSPRNDEERRMQLMDQAHGGRSGAQLPQGVGQNAQIQGLSALCTSQWSHPQRPAMSAEQRPNLSGLRGPAGLSGMDPARLNMFVKYAWVPAQELRARGIPEVAIKWIESYRPMLQRHIQQKQEYHDDTGAGMNANAQRPASNLPASLFIAGGQQGQQMSNSISAGFNMRVEQPQAALQIPLQSGGTGPAPQAQQPPQMANMMPILPIQQRRRPSAQEEEQGAQIIEHIKRDVVSRLSKMRVYSMLDHHRLEFHALLEQAYKYAQEMEPNLFRFACFWKPILVRHVVTMVVFAQHQKQLLDSAQPSYTLEENTLRTMVNHFQAALKHYNSLTAVLYPELAQNRSQTEQFLQVLSRHIMPPQNAGERRVQLMNQVQSRQSGAPATQDLGQNAQTRGPSVQSMRSSQLSPSQRPAMSAEQKSAISGPSGLVGLPGTHPVRLNGSMNHASVSAQKPCPRGIPEVAIKWAQSRRPILPRTIHDVPHYDSPSPVPSSLTSLLPNLSSEKNYGASAPSTPSSKWIVINTVSKVTVIFVFSILFLGGILWLALPTLEECISAFS